MTFFLKIGSSLSKFCTDPCNLFILAGFCVAMATFIVPRFGALRMKAPRLQGEFCFTIGLIFSLWLGAMGPTPMMQQYNYMYVPFMVIAMFYAIALVQTDRTLPSKVTRAIVMAAIVLCGTGRFPLLVVEFDAANQRRQDGLVDAADLARILHERPPDAVFTRTTLGCDKPFIDYARSNGFVSYAAPDGYSTLWIAR